MRHNIEIFVIIRWTKRISPFFRWIFNCKGVKFRFIFYYNTVSYTWGSWWNRNIQYNYQSSSLLSDEEFIKQASHLLIQKELKGRKYIYYKNLATSVDPEILRTYMETILDSMYIIDGRISSIVFKNGLTHKFIYKNWHGHKCRAQK